MTRDARDSESLPTVHTAMAAGCMVDALCLDCDHCRRLDLVSLAVGGRGDVALIRLPLRCQCGSKQTRIIVSGKSTPD